MRRLLQRIWAAIRGQGPEEEIDPTMAWYNLIRYAQLWDEVGETKE